MASSEVLARSAPTPRGWLPQRRASSYHGGWAELCPAIGSGAAPKGHGGPTVTGDQGAMAALRGQGAERPMD